MTKGTCTGSNTEVGRLDICPPADRSQASNDAGCWEEERKNDCEYDVEGRLPRVRNYSGCMAGIVAQIEHGHSKPRRRDNTEDTVTRVICCCHVVRYTDSEDLVRYWSSLAEGCKSNSKYTDARRGEVHLPRLFTGAFFKVNFEVIEGPKFPMQNNAVLSSLKVA